MADLCYAALYNILSGSRPVQRPVRLPCTSPYKVLMNVGISLPDTTTAWSKLASFSMKIRPLHPVLHNSTSISFSSSNNLSVVVVPPMRLRGGLLLRPVWLLSVRFALCDRARRVT